MTRQYRAAAGRARNAGGKAADLRTRGARTVTDLGPGRPRVDLVPAVERYFELVQRTVDINRRLTVRWARAVGGLSGVVREKAESAGDLVREKAEAADIVMREQALKAQQIALEQAEKAAEQARQAENGLARQARQSQREQARRAHKKARERYEGLTKAELSDQLAKRELPKTGNVDVLIERLVEADSK